MKIKVLFLAANPLSSTRLQLDEEARAIKKTLQNAEYRDNFDLITEWAVRVEDMQELLLRHRPHIVHFSGHGATTGEIILQDHKGQEVIMPSLALAILFKILKDNVRCVVLNSCYSVNQADAIAQYIDCVVGMSSAIDDFSACRFAASFYEGLAYARTIKESYELGLVQLILLGLQEEYLPKLLGAADPTTVRLLDASQLQQTDMTSQGNQFAQLGGIIANKDSIVVSNVRGSVYFGNPPLDAIHARRIYLQVFCSLVRQLPLRGIDIGASDPLGTQIQMDLDRVYIALDARTNELVEREQKGDIVLFAKKSALDYVINNRRIVILGDPGSGKSTFLNYLGLSFALTELNLQEGRSTRLVNWPKSEQSLLPISIVLRDFARTQSEPHTKASPQHIWDYIVDSLEAQNLAFARGLLHDALEEGYAIVLLDGLDEISSHTHSAFVRNCVMEFAKRYERCRLVLTCRTLVYQDSTYQLDNFTSIILEPFSKSKIDYFITCWYRELARLAKIENKDADAMIERLNAAMERQELRTLAENPLLLTIMALVHFHRGRLPDVRALLYEEMIDMLLWRWEQLKVSDDKGTTTLLKLLYKANRAEIDLKRILGHLAFDAYDHLKWQNEGVVTADISELQLQKALAKLHESGSLDWAYSIIEMIKYRAGLLLERRPGVFTYPHRTFQEYMAGAFLSVENNFSVKAASLAEQGVLWWQVIQLAVGRLVYVNGDTDKPLALVGELCPNELLSNEIAWRKVILAGIVLHEIGINRVKDTNLGRDLLDRVACRLVELLSQGALGIPERVSAGNTLAQIGDPRFKKDAWFLPNDPWLGFVEIPSGSFFMGSDVTVDLLSADDEYPLHQVSLSAYYIGRYPVTVDQFRAFCVDTKYDTQDRRCLLGLSNWPVRFISWSEAIAYCRWLNEKLRSWPNTPEHLALLLHETMNGDSVWNILMPSEAQWEKAARGVDARLYPWGNEVDKDRMNNYRSGIGNVSPVGAFGAGESPYGCLDMVGNIWEWTRSIWGEHIDKPTYKYPYNPFDGREDLDVKLSFSRIVRGGAFDDTDQLLRCAVRCWHYPNFAIDDIGFRIVLTSIS